ncbi:glycosyltransferase [Streptomyces zingiberis]|uniref:Glycosyltransferase n=1 Tax=Streptomyces zingiberis TaxID=2053010 RepID=A0ABX1BTN9_9ACTN|nr:glycosyltransferase [Streptomyces zingiberis]NJQ01081.1 glycosyltransferase [Streptomyces zingiberis]
MSVTAGEGGGARGAADGGLLIAVITNTAPESTLPRVLDALRTEGAGPGEVVVLFTGEPGGAADRTLEVLLRNRPVEVVRTPRAMRAGEGRQFLADGVRGHRFVAFLDDDCVPQPGWLSAVRAACADPLPTALFFGPRHPVAAGGGGALVRALESRSSKKLALIDAADVPAAVLAPKALSAAGNFVVNVMAAREIGLALPLFARTAFEDVDFQVRAELHGWAVQFHRDLLVEHHDEVGVVALLRKSWHSGKGMARCAVLYGTAFWDKCRLRPWRALLSWAVALLCLAAVPVLPWAAAGALLPVLLNTWLHRRELRGARLSHRALYLLVKPVRDLMIGLGFIVHYAAIRLMSWPPSEWAEMRRAGTTVGLRYTPLHDAEEVRASPTG